MTATGSKTLTNRNLFSFNLNDGWKNDKGDGKDETAVEDRRSDTNGNEVIGLPSWAKALMSDKLVKKETGASQDIATRSDGKSGEDVGNEGKSSSDFPLASLIDLEALLMQVVRSQRRTSQIQALLS